MIRRLSLRLPIGTACRLVVCLAAVFSAAQIAAAAQPREPVRLIFDTDMGNDVDDAMALSMIHAMENRGECKLLAVTVTKDNPYAAAVVDLLNTFYGRGDIPVGVVKDGVTPEDGKYLRQIATAEEDGQLRYPHDLMSGADAPEAVELLRKVLAAQPDGSVVMIQVGFSTNLARLLESKPDDASPLDGRALVAEKVRLLSTMAGGFTTELAEKRFKEYNINKDLDAARKLFAEWPTPVVASGWEIGHAIMQPPASMQEDYGYVANHPLKEAYSYYRGLENPQPTYDLTSVLYAVRPERGYFGLSSPGKIVVEEDGFTSFSPQADGLHRYLTVTPEQIAMVRETQVMLCSEPPQACSAAEVPAAQVPDGAVILLARMVAKPGEEETVRKALLAMVAPTRKEDGCLCYNLHVSADNPGEFTFYEQWASPDALAAHGKSPHMKAMREAIRGRTEKGGATRLELVR